MSTASDATLGIYLSIPFCQAKCSFCNFASGVFARDRVAPYLDRVVTEMREARAWAGALGLSVPAQVDTIYLGGGTPSMLEPAEIDRVFATLRAEFSIAANAEVTVECAPLQLAASSLEAFQRAGVNRLSFGVQSFDDREAAAVGRTHRALDTCDELRRVAAAGMERVGLDLIAGLPHQTQQSWRRSLEHAIDSGVEHISLYMLEVDEDSRLGAEALAGGSRFGAAALPPDDAVADWYGWACERLAGAGVHQYEISNFARAGGASRHNRRYWHRQPYLGLGLDAHSMLAADGGDPARSALRWANTDTLEGYMHGLLQLGTQLPVPGQAQGAWARSVDWVSAAAAFEETLFLGLRLVDGVDLSAVRQQFGQTPLDAIGPALQELAADGLLQKSADRVSLTARGREISNGVFGRLLLGPAA